MVEQVLDLDVARGSLRTADVDDTIYANSGHTATILDQPQSNGVSKHTSHSASSIMNGKSAPSNGSSSVTSSSPTSRDDDSSKESRSTSVTSTDSELVSKIVSSQDIYDMIERIWSRLEKGTGRRYSPFEYTGPADARAALFVFGADAALLGEEMSDAAATDVYANCGLITTRLYRPWSGAALASYLPRTLTRIAVLEHNKRKITRWSPLFLDVLTSYNGSQAGNSSPVVIGYQLGLLERSTIRQALNGIFSNLAAETPLQNLEIGSHVDPKAAVQDQVQEQPELENAYMKMLDQVFSKHLHIANRHEANDAGVSAQMKATPEYGFGSVSYTHLTLPTKRIV